MDEYYELLKRLRFVINFLKLVCLHNYRQNYAILQTFNEIDLKTDIFIIKYF